MSGIVPIQDNGSNIWIKSKIKDKKDQDKVCKETS